MKTMSVFGFAALVLFQTATIQPNQSFDDNKKMNKYLNGGTLETIQINVSEGFDTTRSIERDAILLRRPNAIGNVVMCHGYMCDKFDACMLRSVLFPRHNVLSFDFRAHGQKIDERQCCTFGKDEACEVIAAADYFKNQKEFQELPTGVYGFSMGAVASIHAQAHRSDLFNYMILDCPFSSTEHVIKTGLDAVKFTVFGYTFGLPGRDLLKRSIYHPTVQGLVKGFLKTVSHLDATYTNTHIYPLSPAQLVKKISVPCFFIHCKEDEKVTTAAAYELFSGARGFKRLWITNGRRHFDSFFYNPEKYTYKVNHFINNVLQNQLASKQQQKIFEDPEMG